MLLQTSDGVGNNHSIQILPPDTITYYPIKNKLVSDLWGVIAFKFQPYVKEILLSSTYRGVVAFKYYRYVKVQQN